MILGKAAFAASHVVVGVESTSSEPLFVVRNSPPPLKEYGLAFALLIFGFFFLLACTPVIQESWGLFLFISGVFSGPMLFIGAGILLRRIKQRFEIDVFEKEFLYRRGRLRKRISYLDIKGFKMRQLNSTPFAACFVQLKLSSSVLKLDLFTPLQQSEPRMFLDSLIAGVADCAEERVARGGAISGSGWSLDRNGFRYGKTGRIAISEITRFAVFSGRLCIWYGNRPEASVKIKMTSENTYILMELLDKRLPAAEEQPTETPTGRLLFSKSRKNFATTLLVVSIWLLWITSCVVVLDVWIKDPTHSWSLEVVVTLCTAFLISAALAFGGLLHLTSKVRVYENGISRESLFNKIFIGYERIVCFTWFPMTTETVMKVKAESQRRLRFVLPLNADLDLDALLDHLSRVVLSRMQNDLRGTGKVRWGKDATLTPDSLLLHCRRWFAEASLEAIDLTQPVSYTVQFGMFSIYKNGKRRPIFNMKCSDENFYPGFILFNSLIHQNQSRDVPRGDLQ